MNLTNIHTFARNGGVAAALVVSACGGPSVPSSPLIDTQWEVVSMAESGQVYTPPPGSDVPTLLFTPEVVQDGVRRRLNGSGGCNLLAGSYLTAATDSLGVAALARTRKRCPPEVMGFETRLTRLLVDVTRFRINGSTLTMDHETGEITFRRKTATEGAGEG